MEIPKLCLNVGDAAIVDADANANADDGQIDLPHYSLPYFAHAFDALILTDEQGQFLDVNPSACELLGLPKATLLGHRIADICALDGQVAQIWQHPLPAEPIKGRFCLTRSDGGIRQIDYVVTASGLSHGHLWILRDVTADQASEAPSLPAADDLRVLTAALSACANSIVITDRQGTIQWVNPAFANLTGYTVEEAIGKNPKDLVNSGKHDRRFFQQLWDTILAGRVWHGEITNRRKDGSLYVEEMTITPVLNEQGEISHFIAIKQDISDRQKTETTLRENEANLTALIENTDGSIWSVDRQYRLISSNYQFRANFSHVLQRDVTEHEYVLPPELPTALREQWQGYYDRALQGEKFKVEIQKQTAPRLIWFDYRFCPIQTADGQIIGVSVCGRDITERRQAEEALKQSEAELQALFNAMSDVVLVMDRSGQYIKIPPINSALLIAPAEELLGKTAYDVFPQATAERVIQVIQQVLATQQPQTIEYDFLLNQQTAWFSASVSPLHDHQVVWVSRNITEQKQAEQALKASEKRLRRLHTAVINLGKHPVLYNDDLTTAWQLITETAAQVLQVERVSIWFYDPSHTRIILQDQYELSPQCHSQGIELSAVDYPNYFQALASNEAIVVEQAVSDPRTQEFLLDWLQPHNIQSMMDIPIHFEGKTIGVICHEQVQTTRQWAIEEQNFASYLAHIVALILESRERQRTEAALQHKEAKLLEAQRVAHVGSWELDVLTAKIIWSEESFHLFGFDPAQPEPTYEEHLQRIHPDDRALVQAAVDQIATTGQPFAVDFRIVHPDGSVKYVEGRGEAIHDHQGQTVRLLGTLLDITRRKQAEASLQQQADRQRLLSTITQHIRQSLDLNNILTATVTDVLGLLQCDRVLILRLYPDYTGKVETEALVAGESSLAGETYRCNCPNGCYPSFCQESPLVIDDVATYRADYCPLSYLLGLEAVAQMAIPVLHQDSLWGLLIAQECHLPRHWQTWEADLLAEIANQVSIAIHQAYLYQQVQQFNTKLERQVQERTIELWQSLHFEALLKRITDKVRDSLDEQQILQTAVQELAWGVEIECCDTGIYNAEQTTSTIAYEFTKSLSPAQGKTFAIADAPHVDVYQYLLNGQICLFCDLIPNPVRSRHRLFSVLACPIVDDQGILGDLWLFKHREEVFNELEVRLVQQVANQCAIALRQSRLFQAAQAQVQELERLNRLKDDFLSTVSHELRTPMSNIKMAAQMLEIILSRTDILQTNDRASQYLQILNHECQRETNLINDLLNLSRLDAKVEPLMLTTLDLHMWIPAIAEPFEARTRQQKQQLDIQISADLPSIITDLKYLERILTELLQNACKYTPAGATITIAAVMKRSSPTAPDALQITVTNSGVEISQKELPYVFDKFYRVPNNDPWKHGGTGLGLSLVKKLVERLQGEITVQSCAHQVQFTLTLPLSLTSMQ
ncbi:PAS domain S-box protein [Pantanalinema rosaneae CENA516]|uniref:PAS domain S-box protein n=1 Tax=Pantanalinema rosaneae TaxID=1620701 RepID=UPI003D6DDEFF